MPTKYLLSIIWVCSLFLMASTVTFAQDRSKYPTQMHPSSSGIDWIAFYDKIDALTEETRKEFKHELDIPYGDDPKQKLDLYLPQPASASPVYVFIHGGGFVEGDRV